MIPMAALTAGMNRPGATADLGPGGPLAARTTGPAGGDRSAVVSSGNRAVRSWPLLVLAAPAAAEVWSGWVGIAQKTGFGLVSPLPGILPSLHLDTSISNLWVALRELKISLKKKLFTPPSKTGPMSRPTAPSGKSSRRGSTHAASSSSTKPLVPPP